MWLPSQLLASPPSLFPGEGSTPRRERSGFCQGWDPNSRAFLLFGISACGGPRGNRTWNLDCGARGVQGPLSAAARIDTARPWGQISLPKSLWPLRRPRERNWGGTRRPSHGCPCCGSSWACPWGEPLLSSSWALGHRKLLLEVREGGWMGPHLGSSTPPPSQEWVRTWAPGKSLKLSSAVRQGGGECFQERALGCPRLESPLTGRGLISFSGWCWGIESGGEGAGLGFPAQGPLSHHSLMSILSFH